MNFRNEIYCKLFSKPKHQKFQDLNPLEIFDFTFDARSQYTVK